MGIGEAYIDGLLQSNDVFHRCHNRYSYFGTPPQLSHFEPRVEATECVAKMRHDRVFEFMDLKSIGKVVKLNHFVYLGACC